MAPDGAGLDYTAFIGAGTMTDTWAGLNPSAHSFSRSQRSVGDALGPPSVCLSRNHSLVATPPSRP